MKLFIAGGTGFIGPYVIRRFLEAGWGVKALVRSEKKIEKLPPGVEVILGDPTQAGPWQTEAASCQAAINLTGANIFARWTREYKKEILRTRLESTRRIVEALASGHGQILLNASAVGYYGAHRGEEEVTEESSPGDDFLAEVCRAWEAEALAGEKFGLRVCVMRFGVVLGRDGGALAKMLPAFRLGLGGPIGSGRQWFPWIHVKDVAEAALFLATRDDLQGPFNFVSPGILRQKEFAKLLGKVLKRPAFLPTPAFILRLIFGEMAKIVTGGVKARPKRLLEAGYQFLFPEAFQALKEILAPGR